MIYPSLLCLELGRLATTLKADQAVASLRYLFYTAEPSRSVTRRAGASLLMFSEIHPR